MAAIAGAASGATARFSSAHGGLLADREGSTGVPRDAVWRPVSIRLVEGLTG